MKANDIVIKECELLNTKIYNPEFDSIKVCRVQWCCG